MFDRISEWGEALIEPDGPFERFVFDWYATRTATREMCKIKSGFLLKEMFDHFASKSQGKLSPDRSVWMYFAHDHTIINLLHTLRMYEVQFHFCFVRCVSL